MDLRLREITWVRLVSLLAWTILVMLKRGISQLIDMIEERVFERHVQQKREEKTEREVESATLLPPLSDRLVLERIWPLLHKRVNVSLLWRLRRVSRAWKRNVGVSLEWAALEVVRIDAPGLIRYLEERRERRPPLRERVEDELRAIKVLLSEPLSDFILQPVSLQPLDDRSSWDEGSGSSIGGSEGIAWSSPQAGMSCLGRSSNSENRSNSQNVALGFGEVWTYSTESNSRISYPHHS